MRTLGLIGGTAWVSTLEYYRLLNQGVARRRGGHEAARCIVYSFNFGDVMRAKLGDPEQVRVREMVVDAARRLASVGVHGLMLCANTLHWFAEDVERAVARPLVHIADATAARIRTAGLRSVGLLGTRPTMERSFIRGRLEARGIGVIVPDADGRQFVDRAIYEELVHGQNGPETKEGFLAVVGDLQARGAQGIVLGCTEIPLILKQGDCELPLFDTLAIHASAGVDFLVGDRVEEPRLTGGQANASLASA